MENENQGYGNYRKLDYLFILLTVLSLLLECSQRSEIQAKHFIYVILSDTFNKNDLLFRDIYTISTNHGTK